MNPALVGPFAPTSELVAVAWLGQRVDGIAPGQVATTLPKDPASWADEGFVQAQALPGGQVDIYTHIRMPVVQVDYWAATPKSNKPAWHKANRLAELVRIATEDAQVFGRAVILPADYDGARVLAVYPASDPTRVNDDPSGYARYTQDLAIHWVRQ